MLLAQSLRACYLGGVCVSECRPKRNNPHLLLYHSNILNAPPVGPVLESIPQFSLGKTKDFCSFPVTHIAVGNLLIKMKSNLLEMLRRFLTKLCLHMLVLLLISKNNAYRCFQSFLFASVSINVLSKNVQVCVALNMIIKWIPK